MSITLESLVHLQADRDELLQLLSLLNTHWHQNEEAFCNRSLAEWPQWCEDQGFRFALLTELAHNLESTLSYPEGCPGLDPLITALGPAATTAQLLDSLDQDLPQFLEGFDQLLQISQDETAALGAQAGGSGKGAEWMKDHPGVDAAAAAVIVLGVAGGIIYKKIQRMKQEAADLAQQEADRARQEATGEEEPLVETYEALDAEPQTIREGVVTRKVQSGLAPQTVLDGLNRNLELKADRAGDTYVRKEVGDVRGYYGGFIEDKTAKLENGTEVYVESDISSYNDKLKESMASDAERKLDDVTGVLEQKVVAALGDKINEAVKDVEGKAVSELESDASIINNN